MSTVNIKRDYIFYTLYTTSNIYTQSNLLDQIRFTSFSIFKNSSVTFQPQFINHSHKCTSQDSLGLSLSETDPSQLLHNFFRKNTRTIYKLHGLPNLLLNMHLKNKWLWVSIAEPHNMHLLAHYSPRPIKFSTIDKPFCRARYDRVTRLSCSLPNSWNINILKTLRK